MQIANKNLSDDQMLHYSKSQKKSAFFHFCTVSFKAKFQCKKLTTNPWGKDSPPLSGPNWRWFAPLCDFSDLSAADGRRPIFGFACVVRQAHRTTRRTQQ